MSSAKIGPRPSPKFPTRQRIWLVSCLVGWVCSAKTKWVKREAPSKNLPDDDGGGGGGDDDDDDDDDDGGYDFDASFQWN